MRVQIKLMGMLKSKTPATPDLEVTEGATIADILRQLDIPVDSVQVFTVNGQLQRDQAHVLSDNDELTVLPPVGGG